jgi:hypothetical protein
MTISAPSFKSAGNRLRSSAVLACLLAGASFAVGSFTEGVSQATSSSGLDLLIIGTGGNANATWASPPFSNAFGSVTDFDADVSTPAASDLIGIDVVIVFTNQDFLDPHLTGDLLADFVDAGGRVVQMAYSFACTEDASGPISWGLGGRWESDGYAAIRPVQSLLNNCAQYSWPAGPMSMEIDDQTSPYLQNVGSIQILNSELPSGFDMNTDLEVTPGGTLIASWDNPNEPMIAVGENCVMAANIFPPGITNYTTSQTAIYTLITNLATLPCSTPEPAPESTKSITHLLRGSVDPNGGWCNFDGEKIKSKKQYFAIGYHYLPGPSECKKDGTTFAGWALASSSTTRVVLPLLRHEEGGNMWRFFVADSFDLVAIWSQ